ncbi:MAG TPA: ABC transporter ATP-binding protein [Planctomycetota bacterium]|nr:ABC transporter ATP-binding protein [Planctomycetota bacterium]
MSAPAITGNAVVKQFGETRAVDGVSLRIERGICYALLGPNGAGKSTLSKVIGGRIPADGGNVDVLGLDPWRQQVEVKSRLGVVLQDDAFDEELDVIGNLEIYGVFYWLRGSAFHEKVRALLKFMELDGRERMNIQELSGGMRRRLMIARALLNDPRVLLLDEPTTGLDPQVRHTIWAALRKLKAQGLTILLTTHYMEEAAQLAERVGILHKGKLIAEDSPQNLIEKHVPRWVLEFDAIGRADALQAIRALPRLSAAEQHGDRAFVYDNDHDRLAELVTMHKLDTHVRRASLEDVFLKLTGRSLNE